MAAPPRRPWTPTEQPGDATYTSTVVYHGDRQVVESDSSSEKSVDLPSKPSPGGLEVITDQQQSKSKLISSAALRDHNVSAGLEVATHQPYTKHQAQSTDQDSDNDVSPVEATRGAGLKVEEQQPRYRLSQMPQDPSTESFHSASRQVYSASPPEQDEPAGVKAPRLSQAARVDSHSDLPSVTGKPTRQVNINILLINPNSTKSMTDRCLASLEDSLPINVTVYGFTPTRPAPTAIESQTDAVMSTAACMKAVLPIASKYDAFLVACFSHHPLITALREQLMQPVIGIMEASLYTARMCGSKFGIVTTGVRSMYLLESSVKANYGLAQFCVGAESSRLGVLELESRSEEEVEDRLAKAATKLQAKGADCICLGCAGMTNMQSACQDAVGMHDRVAMVIDGVNMGIHFLIGLVRENLGTAKGGVFNNNSGRKALSM